MRCVNDECVCEGKKRQAKGPEGKGPTVNEKVLVKDYRKAPNHVKKLFPGLLQSNGNCTNSWTALCFF